MLSCILPFFVQYRQIVWVWEYSSFLVESILVPVSHSSFLNGNFEKCNAFKNAWRYTVGNVRSLPCAVTILAEQNSKSLASKTVHILYVFQLSIQLFHFKCEKLSTLPVPKCYSELSSDFGWVYALLSLCSFQWLVFS